MGLLSLAQWIGFILSPVVLLILYARWNDRALTTTPDSVLYFAGSKRVTEDDVHATAKRIADSPPLDEKENLPPKTGRRYIVVGGGGFLGGWIVTKLLKRGEEPHHIRVLDLHPPINHEVTSALELGAQYIKVDVTDAAALEAAFKAPWPAPAGDAAPKYKQSQPEITVFHTAANIRFYERHEEFLERSTRVNVVGTKNVVAAAQAAGATVLVYTSSGSVGVHSTRFLRWPWEAEPARFVQVINDDDARLPTAHHDFFSNYAASKIQAERFVRSADKTPTGAPGGGQGVLRTGCIRPGNGVFGSRGDIFCSAYLVRGTNPSWIHSVVSSFCYVENCAAAHLCYEARLIELLEGAAHPDIGGQAFCVADPGPTPMYSDVYATLTALTKGECNFPVLSPTGMLFFAHAVEWYYRVQQRLAGVLPALPGDLLNLQPSLFSLTSVHLIFDDSRARLAPEKGGLGYTGAWTTFEGLHKTHEEHANGTGRSESRSASAGVSLGLKFGKNRKAQDTKAPATLVNKVNDSLPAVPPMEVNLPIS